MCHIFEVLKQRKGLCCGDTNEITDAVARAGCMVRGGLVAVDGLAGLHVDLMVQLSYVAGGGRQQKT